MAKKNKEKLVSVSATPRNSGKILNTVFGLALIAGFTWLSLNYIPNNIFAYTRDAIAVREKAEAEQKQKEASAKRATQTEEENKVLGSFANRSVNMKTNFGDIKINLQDKAAPKTSESFLRLSYRGYYNGLGFHRMEEGNGFDLIQGGDPKGDGSGGESAFGTPLEDEIFKVKPEFSTDDQGVKSITNNPEFVDSGLYTDYSKDRGTVKYRKGLVVMANSGPNTGGSQFFITLNDIGLLEPNYTVFGVVDESSLAVLDKISAEVDPVTQEGSQLSKPNKEIKIEKIDII